MADFAALAKTAERLIAENGRDVSLVRRDRTAGDPSKPWRGPPSPGSPASVTVRVAFVSDAGLGREESNVAGSLDRRGVQFALVAATAVAPNLIETFDAVVDEGTIWQIVEVHMLKPGETLVIYAIEVRR